jgi:hypothetical protein
MHEHELIDLTAFQPEDRAAIESEADRLLRGLDLTDDDDLDRLRLRIDTVADQGLALIAELREKAETRSLTGDDWQRFIRSRLAALGHSIAQRRVLAAIGRDPDALPHLVETVARLPHDLAQLRAAQSRDTNTKG